MPFKLVRSSRVAPAGPNSTATPSAEALRDPLTETPTLRQRRAAQADLTRERTEKRYDRDRLGASAARIARNEAIPEFDSPEARIEAADRRIGRAMRLVDAHTKVPEGRAKRIKTLATSLTDDPANAALAPSFDGAVARLKSADMAAHPEARAGLAGLALADIDGKHAGLQAEIQSSFHAERVDAIMDGLRDAPLAILPDLAKIAVDYAVDPVELTQGIAKKQATPYLDRPQSKAAKLMQAAVRTGAVVGATAGAIQGAIGGPMVMAALGVAGALNGAMIGGGSVAMSVGARAVVREVSSQRHARRLDREFRDAGNQQH